MSVLPSTSAKYAMREPSGDHDGPAPGRSSTGAAGVAPATSTTKRLRLATDSNAIREPSGDHAGEDASSTPGASSMGSAPGPSSRNSVPGPEAQHATTIRVPSGDQNGCAIVSMPSVTGVTSRPSGAIT